MPVESSKQPKEKAGQPGSIFCWERRKEHKRKQTSIPNLPTHIKRLKNAVAREVKIVLVLPKRAAVEIIRMLVIQHVRANNKDVQMVKLSKLKISKNNLLQL